MTIPIVAIVLVFPTWWFSFPVILKGWFDRVWAPGVAYDHADQYGPIKARLMNLRHMMAVTSLGAPWRVDKIVLSHCYRLPEAPAKILAPVALLNGLID